MKRTLCVKTDVGTIRFTDENWSSFEVDDGALYINKHVDGCEDIASAVFSKGFWIYAYVEETK